MMRHSLRWRLALGGGLAIVAALALAGAALTSLFERHLVRSLAGDLDATLRLVLGAVELTPEGGLALTREPADPRFEEPLSGLYWQVSRDRATTLRSRSLWDARLPLPSDELKPGASHHHRIRGPAGAELLAAERRVLMEATDKTADIRVTVAADMARVAEARREFRADLAKALSLLGLALGLAMWVQIGLGLKPLERLRESILSIRRGRAKAVAHPVPREIEPLVDEINALLATQAREMERSRGRAADLAHGLKTPLTALAADSRRLREQGETAIADDIDAVGETMRRHVEREMARARIRGRSRSAVETSTPVRPLVDQLVATLARTPDGERIRFEVVLPSPLALPMEKADLAEVLGNLLENAARYARSRVIVRAIDEATGPAIAVEDDGPGVPEAELATILERGSRLDGRGPGAGLGLAIVSDVLDAYGRKLILTPSPLGGLRAILG